MNVPGLLPVVDGLLAAAKARGLTLVTRNTADLARTGQYCSIRGTVRAPLAVEGDEIVLHLRGQVIGG